MASSDWMGVGQMAPMDLADEAAVGELGWLSVEEPAWSSAGHSVADGTETGRSVARSFLVITRDSRGQ